MPLKIRCAGCGRLLRVAEEHAGKALRCPACNHIGTAPAAGGASAAASLSASGWHLRTPDGQVFGPVSHSDLERWLAEGRVAADCSLAEQAGGPWRPAAAVFPVLKQRVTAAPVGRPAFQPASPFGDRLPAAAGFAGSPAASYQVAHRGGLVLVLGLVGFISGCPIFSLMAWVMGSSDLREMRAGRMDPSGEGVTQAGQILGMILSVLWILAAVLILFFFLLAAVAGR
ncbi:MAG: hypothetical protein WD872_03595 [Pirellulaceae bacterium]